MKKVKIPNQLVIFAAGALTRELIHLGIFLIISSAEKTSDKIKRKVNPMGFDTRKDRK